MMDLFQMLLDAREHGDTFTENVIFLCMLNPALDYRLFRKKAIRQIRAKEKVRDAKMFKQQRQFIQEFDCIEDLTQKTPQAKEKGPEGDLSWPMI